METLPEYAMFLSGHQKSLNWHRLLHIIQTEVDSTQRLPLLQFSILFQRTITNAPASSQKHFHNAFPGGYLDHVLRVFDVSRSLYQVYKNEGGQAEINPSTLAFVSLVHDLGKLGDLDAPWYLHETESHLIKKGSFYKKNPQLGNIGVNDQTIMLLHQYGIPFSKEEMLAIKLTDGLYSNGNDAYLKGNGRYPFQKSLPHIMHWADHMATTIEQDFN